MAITYDRTLKTDMDRVRFLVGDTDITNGVAHDEEILWALTTEHNVWMAAASVYLSIGRQLRAGGVQDLLVGETRIRYDRALEMEALAQSIRARGMAHMQPTAGGIFTADRTTYEDDTALEQGNVGVAMHDNPQSSAQNSTTMRSTT